MFVNVDTIYVLLTFEGVENVLIKMACTEWCSREESAAVALAENFENPLSPLCDQINPTECAEGTKGTIAI